MTTNLIILTGSHPTPAEALKTKLLASGYKVKILTVSTPKFNRQQKIYSTLSLIKLPLSILKAKKELFTFKPSLVVSFGGYQALPVCVAAKLLNLPLLIHEQTFTLGLTSRLTSLLADKIAVSWASSLSLFPKKKTTLTGNLLRQEILSLKRQSKTTTSKSTPKTIYITGGHFGSLTINQAIKPILKQLLSQYIIYHQLGLHQSAKDLKDFKELSHPHYHQQPWFDLPELKKIYSQADLVISRSGINTVSELAYLKIPAVLIPLTTAQKNEQLTNAKYLELLGLALILDQTRLNSDSLLQAITQAFKTLPQKPQTFFNFNLITHATDKLFTLVKELINHEVKTN